MSTGTARRLMGVSERIPDGNRSVCHPASLLPWSVRSGGRWEPGWLRVASVQPGLVEALGTLGTARATDILARLTRANDELGRRARLVSQRRRRTGLSEREIEVVQLAAAGGTNRDIAERLSLSQHTIARHLANARAKLGAANRTEAAVKLEELDSLARD